MIEAELAKNFIYYLQDSFDLYYEANNIDIVGINGKILIGVEVKTSLSFKVIEQAWNNRNLVHYSYVAVPWVKNSQFKYDICAMFGIGVLTFRPYNRTFWDVREELKPKLVRHAHTKWFKPHPNLKRSKPGSPSGPGIVSAFNITVENIEKHVARHPGCTIKELFNGINHHYSGLSSMRGCIYKYIRDGVINNIEVENSKLYIKND